MKKRVAVFVDGYNLYCAMQKRGGSPTTCKWLNLKSFCSQFLEEGEVISEINYYTALCSWNDRKNATHRLYIKILKDNGIHVIEGKFAKQEKTLHKKKFWDKINIFQKILFLVFFGKSIDYIDYEEKITDVRIGCDLLNKAHKQEFDTAFIVSCDGDLFPAVEYLINDFSPKNIKIIRPINSYLSKIYRNVAKNNPARIKVVKTELKHYENCQFNPKYTLKNGQMIKNPYQEL